VETNMNIIFAFLIGTLIVLYQCEHFGMTNLQTFRFRQNGKQTMVVSFSFSTTSTAQPKIE